MTTKQIIYSVFLGAFLISINCYAQNSGSQDNLYSEIAFNKGIESIKSGNYNEAITNLTEAINYNHLNKDAILTRALIYLELKDIEKSKKDFNEVLNLDPNNKDALYNVAYIEFIDKNYNGALEHFNNLINSGFEQANVFYY